MTEVTATPPAGAEVHRERQQIIRFLLRDQLSRVGLALAAFSVFLAIFGPLIFSTDPLEIISANQFLPPSLGHPFGTDELGRDLFARCIVGLRLSLAIGIGAALLAALGGIPWGLVSGFSGSIVDRGLMRLADAVLAFPVVILAIATAMILGPGVINSLVAIAIATMPQLSRLIRSQTLSEREKDYVLASLAIGTSRWRILFEGILPNTLSTILVFIAVTVPRAVLIEAALGFLGLSQRPPTPTLGGLVASSRQFMDLAPWYAILPGALIIVVVAGLTLLGMGLTDAVHPNRRRGFGRSFR